MKASPVQLGLCSTCGRTLNPKGECLACLVRIGFDQPLAVVRSAMFGDYEVARRQDGSFWELGRGAMGVTYRAEDKVLKRSVALKVIEAPEVENGGQVVRERFLREARAAAAFRHPNVAGVFHFGASPGGDGCYYAMELVEGETLEALVRRDGPLKVETALEIAVQVTRALIAAATHGLLHRDLKPGNIMLTQSDATAAELEVKVIDFGLAKAIAESGTEMDLTRGGFIGTPAFASPEQFSGAPADARSDIYSLGVTLWYALIGEVPYTGKTIEEIRHCQSDLPLPVEKLVARKIPRPVIQLLRRVLAVDPTQRPASARELLDALESCRSRLGVIPAQGLNARQTGRKLAALVVVMAIAVAVSLAFWLRGQKASDLARAPVKSIAVLPFENRSEDKANAYFADGIQDEILTRLSKIADLKVISRTSTQRYQSKPRNLREIAKQLGVANILEGSVQKAADQVRVNVQLINAQTDSHLWAETFDRKLTDIFSVESEIAKGIAESLRAKLTGRDEQALAVKPTNNPEAYDAYLRGLAFEARSNPSFEAADFYERAVQIDPSFATAWARLSRAEAHLYFDRGSSAAAADAAKRALENAQRLEPESPETLLALGYYQYWVLRDNRQAKTTFQRVTKLVPSSSEVPRALGTVARSEGHWDQSVAYFEQALALNPRDVDLLTDGALTYVISRQLTAALKLYDRALDIVPNDPEAMAEKARIYQAQGNLQEAARFLAEINEQTPNGEAVLIKITQLRLERNYSEAVRLLKMRLAHFHFASDYEKAIIQVVLALSQHLAGDSAGAKVTAGQTRKTLEPLYKNDPNNSSVITMLSLADALLGEKDSALKVASTLNRAKSPRDEHSTREQMAVIQTVVGENSRAISTLRQLLGTPYIGGFYYPTSITAALLRLDPFWDPLRADPAFQELCDEKKP